MKNILLVMLIIGAVILLTLGLAEAISPFVNQARIEAYGY